MNLRVRGFLGRVVVATSALVVATGCSGDDGSSDDGSGGAQTGGTGGSTGGSASGTGGSAQGGSSGGLPPLFTSAPDCDSNVERLEGTFQGAAVGVNQSVGSTTLNGRFYYTVGLGRSRIRLQWGNAIAPNVVQPLTEGGYVLTFWDTTNPDVLYCITAGEIGFIETESLHEYFKYSITRVRSGEVGTTPNSQPALCDGEEITVDLLGCVQRD